MNSLRFTTPPPLLLRTISSAAQIHGLCGGAD
jgi:hypothetical protein